MLANPYTAAQYAQEDAMPSRLQEALALEKANVLLQRAINDPEDKNIMSYAISKTGQMWAIFQASLSEDDHPMPVEIRANVISLSIFVDKQLMKALAEQSVDPLKSIININKQIALGLKGDSGNVVRTEKPVEGTGGRYDYV